MPHLPIPTLDTARPVTPPMHIGAIGRANGLYYHYWTEGGRLLAQLRSTRDPLDLTATPWRWDAGAEKWLPAYDVTVT